MTERHLADHPGAHKTLARRLSITHQAVSQIEAAGLRKLGFFGEPIKLTRQQLQNIFKNAKEDDLSRLTPKELELLKRLYSINIISHNSYPTIKSVTGDLNVNDNVSRSRHETAMQKLLHTKRAIRIDMSLTPTFEQVEFMRQKISREGAAKVAKDMRVTEGVVRRWLRQERIESRLKGRPQMSPSLEELEFLKTNYPDKSLYELRKLTGHSDRIITRWLRDAGVTIRKRGMPKNS